MNKKSCLLIFVLIVVVVLITISLSTSTSVSSYRSEINGSINARVAKWSVSSVTKKNGESIFLEAGFKDNIIEGSGNWFFDIENASEVNAAIQKNSTITLRLDANNLSSQGESISWNFLDNIDNPVHFKIYVYQASAEQLLFYQKNSGEKIETISFTEYSQKTDEEKEEYVEVIDTNGKTEIVILDTDTSSLTFVKKQELEDTQMVSYYEYTLTLGNQLSNDFSLGLGLDTSKSNICFRVEWSVEQTSDSSEEIDVVEQTSDSSEEEKKYNTYTIVEEKPAADSSYTTYMIDGKEYYIDIQEKNFFDYLKYTSSLGGEPYFEFPSNESDLKGAQLIVFFSYLTTEQKEKILNYKNQTIETMEDLTHLKEYLEYTEYSTFQSDYQKFIEQLPYLSMGLKISIQFDLRVEQVD